MSTPAPAPTSSDLNRHTTMAAKSPPLTLTLILAATPSLGIGKNGALPWPMLKKEMAYFARVTKRVSPYSSSGGEGGEGKDKKMMMNAVIMGRKTWDSIPERLRPLKGRVNVVVTRDVDAFKAKMGVSAQKEKSSSTSTSTSTSTSSPPSTAPEGPIVCSGILAALNHLSSSQQQPYTLDKIFCIGGASLYTTALELPATKHILLTKIHKEYECDTFFSQNVEESAVWRRAGRQELEDFVGESVEEGLVEEQGVGFEFCLFSKIES
ncbi:hypothetical protein NX059_000300 [Plenodomus lindquistii]|nr:hypothetical protein NX059_000300 [Plenodomus lindquistii]